LSIDHIQFILILPSLSLFLRFIHSPIAQFLSKESPDERIIENDPIEFLKIINQLVTKSSHNTVAERP